ncbi:uncharacterized protein LOC119833752 [Zerene cesonia]|uniref:uncharacterized protein LOC119833752 n=1 Tax=Zerene cesonia TaxID=33412 RepID=UPI0018E528DD|nr:uncharacterized protein LOC119833752 [Zerene cesonia]
MYPVNNNQFEVTSTKRKIKIRPNVYRNPALDLLANEDPMCNTAMEVTPNKRRKRTMSCDIAAFENTALDLGISKAAMNEFLVRELQNVNKNIQTYETPIKTYLESSSDMNEPVYANLISTPPLPPRNCSSEVDNEQNTMPDMNHCRLNESVAEIDSGISILEQKSTNELENNDLSEINNITNIQTNVTNQLFVNNSANLNLSFIDRLALDSPQTSNKSLYFDDDLNESNIMEIKTITIITKKKIVPKKITNPFLDPNLDVNVETTAENPFLNENVSTHEMEYNEEALTRPIDVPAQQNLMPRRLFANDTNNTISTVNESSLNTDSPEYENVEYRPESPIYENIDEMQSNEDPHYNKQSKILGHDVSKFSALDIMNLNKMLQTNSSTESTDSRKDLKHHILKVSNKLSKKVFKTLKKTFKAEKIEHSTMLNPYEVPRKPPKEKVEKKDSGIENPALKLDNSDDIEIEELIENEEEQYETIKTLRNTRMNSNVTPLKERSNDNDLSHNKTYTPGKKVRFDSTLNREKVITGDSFDCDIQSPGFDAKIDKYHVELENSINERKFIQQNM